MWEDGSIQRGGEGEIKRMEHTLLSIPVTHKLSLTTPTTYSQITETIFTVNSCQFNGTIHLLYCTVGTGSLLVQ